MNLLEKYNQLNNSFTDKKLIFHLGADAGFFSEYNNMIFAMLYCLEHKIKFVLYSRNANFGYKNGWTDYFLPFCEENTHPFHSKFNVRYRFLLTNIRLHWLVYNPPVFIYHLFNRNTYLTYQMMEFCEDKKFEESYYNIPELGIQGNLQEACRQLINMTWRYNNPTKKIVGSLVSSLGLPAEYIGFHIRQGDKDTETDVFNFSKYIEKASRLSNIRDAFVLTDDYTIIENLRNQYTDWNIWTLCRESERGYFHKRSEKGKKSNIKYSHERLFASIEILSHSSLFVGAFSSNPGLYLGMRMNNEKSVGLDSEKWKKY